MVPMKGDDGKPMGWTMVFHQREDGGGVGGVAIEVFELLQEEECSFLCY
jgi:hypothetical protein